MSIIPDSTKDEWSKLMMDRIKKAWQYNHSRYERFLKRNGWLQKSLTEFHTIFLLRNGNLFNLNLWNHLLRIISFGGCFDTAVWAVVRQVRKSMRLFLDHAVRSPSLFGRTV